MDINESLENIIGTVAKRNRALLSKAFGLSNDELDQKILWRLSMLGPQSSKDLSIALMMPKSSISLAISNLIENGIVERGTKGKNGSEPIQIREEYQKIIESHRLEVQDLVCKTFEVLSDESKNIILIYLTQVLDRIGVISETIENIPSNIIIYKHSNRISPKYFTNTARDSRSADGPGKDNTESLNIDIPNTETRYSIIERRTRTIHETFEKKIKYK